MKKIIINLLLDSIIDLIFLALKRLANKTDSQVDDALIKTLVRERDQMTDEIKSAL